MVKDHGIAALKTRKNFFVKRRRAPTFALTIEESLLTFHANKPALPPLFQFPPTIASRHERRGYPKI
ncbi:MAG: hypothetical protein FWE91_09105 [Defluviitaleaceae bacterium]|nr:hypothetical protein [Defluviitaleaceae bacterium]MCL2835790.1 hypothetical protein [Defluviitaleaceae bacterium]